MVLNSLSKKFPQTGDKHRQERNKELISGASIAKYTEK